MTLKVLGNKSSGMVFVVSAPAGTGKTTLTRMLCDEFHCIVENVSYTTRHPRAGETFGKDYYFVSKEEFAEMVQKGEFLEHAEVFGHSYGTSKKEVFDHVKNGKHVILVIDTQGAQRLMDIDLEASYIFIKPPSLLELKQRLFKRSTETEESVLKRLSWAEKEIALAPFYDYVIINDNLAHAYDVLRSVIIAEEHKN